MKAIIVLLIAIMALAACSSTVKQSSISSISGSAVVETVVDEPETQQVTKPVEPTITGCAPYDEKKAELDALQSQYDSKDKEALAKSNELETVTDKAQQDALISSIDALNKEMNILKPQIRLLQRQVDAARAQCT